MFGSDTEDIPPAEAADGGSGQVSSAGLPGGGSGSWIGHAAPVEGPEGNGHQ